MITQNSEIFINQTEPKTVEISNLYNCESMVLQIEAESPFVLRVSGRTNSKFEYQPMSVISSNFNVYSDITSNGTYSISSGGKSSIQIQLLSIDSGFVNCYANLY